MQLCHTLHLSHIFIFKVELCFLGLYVDFSVFGVFYVLPIDVKLYFYSVIITVLKSQIIRILRRVQNTVDVRIVV